MVVSTRGRYALRVMVDLAENSNGEFIPLREIALRQDISQKYIEGIMTDLSKAGLVIGLHGKGGGYKLAHAPEKCSVKSVLEVTETSLLPVACLGAEQNCERKNKCKTLPLWKKFTALVDGFFSTVTIGDLVTDAEENAE